MIVFKVGKKNFSLHRTFAQPSLHFKQNFSGVVYAPIPFHLSLASRSLYDHKQEKVRGNTVCLGVRGSKVPHKSHLIHYIPKSATLHSSKLVIILNLSSASLALFCSLMTASAFSFFILDISSCN